MLDRKLSTPSCELRSIRRLHLSTMDVRAHDGSSQDECDVRASMNHEHLEAALQSPWPCALQSVCNPSLAMHPLRCQHNSNRFRRTMSLIDSYARHRDGRVCGTAVHCRGRCVIRSPCTRARRMCRTHLVQDRGRGSTHVDSIVVSPRAAACGSSRTTAARARAATQVAPAPTGLRARTSTHLLLRLLGVFRSKPRLPDALASRGTKRAARGVVTVMTALVARLEIRWLVVLVDVIIMMNHYVLKSHLTTAEHARVRSWSVVCEEHISMPCATHSVSSSVVRRP